MTRLSLVTPLIYALLLTFASCGNKNHENAGAVWGTTYRILYSGPRDLSDSIVMTMKNVEDVLSMFSTTSVVSRINSGEDIPVDSSFTYVFNLSRRVSELTGGAFDPTVGPLTNLWGFGIHKTDSLVIPSQEKIDSTLQSVGISDCRIVDSRVKKKNPATKFDFSSIAKGYGVDAVANMLARNGCTDYLVEIGGEIAAKGTNSRRQPWHVQIDAPLPDTPAHIAMLIVPLEDRAVATSGNYRNYRETHGKRFGHTLDPHTGYPVETATLSASVIAPDCATADALATACMVMDPDKALQMIENLPATEALLAVESNDSIALRYTSGFPL